MRIVISFTFLTSFESYVLVKRFFPTLISNNRHVTLDWLKLYAHMCTNKVKMASTVLCNTDAIEDNVSDLNTDTAKHNIVIHLYT